MKKDSITVNISKNESKSEILYDNIVSNMESMKLNKDEQIEYLKTRVSILEQENKRKIDLVILCLSCLFSLVIGIALLILNFYTLGSFVVVGSCSYGVVKTYMLASKDNKFSLDKYEEVEAIRKIISSKLK
jgi:hypothetical protein